MEPLPPAQFATKPCGLAEIASLTDDFKVGKFCLAQAVWPHALRNNNQEVESVCIMRGENQFFRALLWAHS